MDLQLYSINHALDGGNWLTSLPKCVTTGSHWIGWWVGFRPNLDSLVKEKYLCLYWDSNLGRPVC